MATDKKLSELLEEGRKKREQCKFEFFTHDDQFSTRSCDVGAIYEALHGLPESLDDFDVDSVAPYIVDTLAPYEDLPEIIDTRNKLRIALERIVHNNDWENMTTDENIEYLESLGL